MEILSSFEQYGELKSRARTRCGKLSTNCTLLSTGIKEIIRDGSLFYEEHEAGLVLYSDEGEYYRAFYWFGPDSLLPQMRQNKLVTIEELDGADGRRSDYLRGFFQKLESAEWRRIARNVYVERFFENESESVAAEYANGVGQLAAQGLRLEFCTSEQVAGVMRLWHDYLRETDIPAEHLHFTDDETQKVACVLNEGGFVCAVNWWQFKGGRCETRHIVTDPGYCKRGIASVLLNAAIHDAIREGCRSIFTYIDEVNYPSLALFEKAGIVPNGRVAYQYGLEGMSNG